MNINYNITGKPRKCLVEAIAKTMGLEDEIKYLGAPSYAYQIGDDFIVDRNGIVTLPDLPEDLASQLLVDLKALGFEPEDGDAPTKEAEVSDISAEEAEASDTNTPEHEDESDHIVEPEPASEPEHASEPEQTSNTEPTEDVEHPVSDTVSDSDLITVSIKNDLTGDEEERLFAIVESKRSLLLKALEAEELPIEVDKDIIRFPWFTNHNIEGEAIAYTQLITAIVKMAKKQKRVVAKDKPEENEKFAMRIFTVRLGLKGDEYKLIRKLLSKNLSGNSSWKHGKPAKPANTAPERPTKDPEPVSAEVVDGDTSNITEVNTNE